MSAPITVWLESEGSLLRVRLSKPKANLIDAAMINALDRAFASHLGNRGLSAVLLDAEGQNFSYGASIAEHMPSQCEAMLAGLHGLILRMLESPVTILVAAKGQCLGGGLEIALAGHLLFVASDTILGQPEMKLGVFAPAASCLLPELIGQARALDLLLSGRTISGTEAVAIGMAREAATDPERAALAYFDEYLKPKSASSLRYAIQAARSDYMARVKAKIKTLERLYLDDLMRTHDAIEGLGAFVEKRPVQWQHR